ncbi:uncharacterized protein LOC128987494 isoform X2 [Macrosteles quadrilineatus]|uniref:uncharacterized protein LOC128987494 isoform X2 n=1 Tax=Macrosteles quadrilineatus TaxID=74068 RepID=UPI0023E24DBA|nr:uncharacterized protein LOC128987494 isoform X2 [Macrosteles quadrilineatus]
MVSLVVRCSTLFAITVYISGGESYDASVGKLKKQDNTQHDLSVYFRPMLGKRAKYFVPRLGKREEEDSPYLLLDADRGLVAGAKPQEADDSRDISEVQNPLIFRWYDTQGRRSFFTPRLGKRTGFYTPRLGKRLQETQSASPFSPRLGKRDFEGDYPLLWDSEDSQEYGFPRERRREKEDKPWKVIGMFNPRLGRSVPREISDYDTQNDLKNNVSYDGDID